MATTTSQIDSAEVREVREQFERWRSGKEGRERIPVKLWGMAAKLCETYGLNRVARALRLNYTALKVEANRQSPDSRRPGFHSRCRQVARKPAFVECSLPAGMIPAGSSVEYVVEAPDHRGGTPRILVRGASVSEVAALVRALRTADDGSGST